MLNGDLQQALRAHGLFWPPDPTSAPYCSIGGNLACNAGGPRAVKYGATPRQRAGADGRHRQRRTGAPRRRHHEGLDRLRPVAPADRFRRHARADRRGDAEADAAAAGATPAARAVSRCRSRRARGGAPDGAAGDALDARVHGCRLRAPGARDRRRRNCPSRRAADDRGRRRRTTAASTALAALRAAADGEGCLASRARAIRTAPSGCGRRARRCRRRCARSRRARSTRTSWCRCRACRSWWTAVGAIAARAGAAHRLLRPCRQRQHAREPAVTTRPTPRQRPRAPARRWTTCSRRRSRSAASCPASTASAWPSANSWRARSIRRRWRSMRAIKAVFDPDGILNPGKLLPPSEQPA